jgi:hypothetical protein
VVRIDVVVELLGRDRTSRLSRENALGIHQLSDPAVELVDDELGTDVAVAIPRRVGADFPRALEIREAENHDLDRRTVRGRKAGHVLVALGVPHDQTDVPVGVVPDVRSTAT